MAKLKKTDEEQATPTVVAQPTAEVSKLRIIALLHDAGEEAKRWRTLCEREGRGTMLPKSLYIRLNDIAKVLQR